jgi:HEAT repeat protein
LKTLRSVARNSSNPEHRAIAVWVLGYAPDKRAVVDDLVYALEDGDSGVRNNSTRALAAIGSLAERKPELKIRIPISRFVAMLNSIEWTDRNKGLFALQSLATRANPDALKYLRNRALSSLIEMARWQSKLHAFPAFVLVGRIAQMEERDILSQWPTT